MQEAGTSSPEKKKFKAKVSAKLNQQSDVKNFAENDRFPPPPPPPTPMLPMLSTQVHGNSAAYAQFDLDSLVTRVFGDEREMLEVISLIFPKGIKMCRKDKWKSGVNAGLHKKWRFVCECGE